MNCEKKLSDCALNFLFQEYNLKNANNINCHPETRMCHPELDSGSTGQVLVQDLDPGSPPEADPPSAESPG